MNLEGRYDDKVSDMLLLLQQGLIRFLGQKPIDLQKFKFYFNKCFEQMKRIQEHFHQLSTKFTEPLSKLKQFCQKNDQKTTIQPKSLYSQYEHKVFTLSSRSGSVGKASQLSRQLLSIKQQAQDSSVLKKNNRQRVQTAKNRSEIQDKSAFINVRPMTGKKDQRLNHRLLNQSKTISNDTVRSFRQSTDSNHKKSSKSSKKKITLNIQQQPTLSSPQVQRRKKLLYESLSKQKQIQFEDSGILADSKVLSLFKKRIKNQNRWNRQIAQLI